MEGSKTLKMHFRNTTHYSIHSSRIMPEDFVFTSLHHSCNDGWFTPAEYFLGVLLPFSICLYRTWPARLFSFFLWVFFCSFIFIIWCIQLCFRVFLSLLNLTGVDLFFTFFKIVSMHLAFSIYIHVLYAFEIQTGQNVSFRSVASNYYVSFILKSQIQQT